jgi:NitT/TauT family transport system substrate-binding protein
MRRTWTLCVGLLLSVALGLAGGPAGAAERATLRLNFTVNGMHAPLYAALDQGFYKAEGIDLEILEGKGTGPTVQLMAAGTDTFAYAELGTMMTGVAKGLPLKAVMLAIPEFPYAVIALQESGIKQPKDLIGKRLATNPGIAGDKAFLEANGLTGKVEVVYLAAQTKIQAVLLKKADATTGLINSQVPSMEAQGARVNIMKFSDWGALQIGYGFFVNTATIRDKPDLLQRFLRATLKGYEFARRNPDPAVDDLMKHFPNLPRDLMARMWALTVPLLDAGRKAPFGRSDRELWEKTQDLLVKHGGQERSLPVESYYTEEFLPR